MFGLEYVSRPSVFSTELALVSLLVITSDADQDYYVSDPLTDPSRDYYGVPFGNRDECREKCDPIHGGDCAVGLLKLRRNKKVPFENYYCWGTCPEHSMQFGTLENCERECRCRKGVCLSNQAGNYTCDISMCNSSILFPTMEACYARCNCADFECTPEEDGGFSCFRQNECELKKKYKTEEQCERKCLCSYGVCLPSLPNDDTFQCFPETCYFETRYETMDICKTSKACDCRGGRCVRRQSSTSGLPIVCERVYEDYYCDHDSKFTTSELCAKSCTCKSGKCTGSGSSFSCVETSCDYSTIFETPRECDASCSCRDSKCAVADELHGIAEAYKCQKVAALKKLDVECNYFRKFETETECTSFCLCPNGKCKRYRLEEYDFFECTSPCGYRYVNRERTASDHKSPYYCSSNCQCPYPTFCKIQSYKSGIRKCLLCSQQYGLPYYYTNEYKSKCT